MRREIRLREFEPGSSELKRPLEWQVKGSDGSLAHKDYLVEADENGFIKSALPQDDMREQVIILGDSVIECMYVDHGSRLTDQAERFLRQDGLSVAVRNGGVTGATSLHILNSILNKIVPLRPSLLIVASGIMDQDCMLNPDSFWNKQPYFTPIKTYPDQHVEEQPHLAELQMPDRRRILRLIKATCEEFAIRLAVATVAHRGNDAYAVARMPWFQNYQDRRRKVNAQTREFAITEGVPLIDMESEFSGAVSIFYDQFHLNPNGTEVVGRFLANEIKRVSAVASKAAPADGFIGRIKRSLSR